MKQKIKTAQGCGLLLLLGFVGCGVAGILMGEPEQPTPSASVTEEASQEKPVEEPDVTAKELEAFTAFIREVDPDSKAISGIKQFENTGTLTLTVGPEFLASSKIEQGDAAIGLRDKWRKTCDCVAILSFQTQAGQELIHIGWDQPKFRQ